MTLFNFTITCNTTGEEFTLTAENLPDAIDVARDIWPDESARVDCPAWGGGCVILYRFDTDLNPDLLATRGIEWVAKGPRHPAAEAFAVMLNRNARKNS